MTYSHRPHFKLQAARAPLCHHLVAVIHRLVDKFKNNETWQNKHEQLVG